MPPRPASIVVSYFDLADLATLTEALAAAGFPDGTSIYIGSYGVNPTTAAAVRQLSGGLYAPLFKIHPTDAWAGRRHLTPAERDRVPAAFDGPIPAATVDELSRRVDRLEWGRELGRRFRDALRHPPAGVAIAAWQFDEVLAQVDGADDFARGYRELTRGVLDGLLQGRRELADPASPGIVWSAAGGIRLARRPAGSAELTAYWRSLNRASRLFVGEEYVAFRGDPRAAAAQGGQLQRLLDQGTERRSIFNKYALGLTPGYHCHSDLGGNVDGQPRRWVNDWRSAHLAARAASAPVAGFAQFNFRVWNSWREVMDDALRAIALASQRS